ncbi:carboxypeptidase-like regulatory domain-containing protein [Acidipila sp. EB88]|uniref:carboxypeptidase-like regulatory domain-containing protein n=1 Tax=Acidipila sp. EB88 TaxID=2305226 RepID=UPI001F20EA32|nr:carboxypeptidase-like regulatory domain-containing protein [Acidipila sp. EB88]
MCSFSGTTLHAQTTNASLSGTVTDASGASIGGAQISVVSNETAQTLTATTSDEGTYTITSLPPGTYTVTVTKQGFTTSVQNGLQLTVGQAATLKATLAIGATSETVQVNAAGQVINQSTAEISELVNERSVKELPLNGRDPSSLVLLAPGTTNILASGGPGVLQTTNAFPNETGASANGGRQGSTYYLLDGVQNMDTYLLLAAPFPNADATQEFRVITNNFDSRYGFAPGAVVTIQTKSGSNQFHGGLFEFLRNDALNAGNYFTHAVDPLKRNQFGGYVGGPIKKDRIFFFANYQQTRASTQTGTNITFDPTPAMLAGDFSAVPQALGTGLAVNPFTTVNGKPNQINPALFNPAAVAISALFPVGQVASTGQVNYAGAPETYNFQEATGRVDYDISTTQRLSVRNFLEWIDQPEQTLTGNILNNTLGETGRLYNELISHTWTISPTSINVISGAFLENDFYSAAHVANAQGQPWCFSQYIAITDPAGTCYSEGGVQVTNGPAMPYTAPNRENRRTWTITDDYSKVLGQHTLTVGGDALHQFANEVAAYPQNATIDFNGQYTGFGLADFLLGDANFFRQGAGESQSETGIVLGIYAQDAWRIKPNLTFTYGVRWEPNLPPSVPNGRGAAFIPGEQSTRYPGAPLGLVFPGDPGVDAELLPHDYRQFGPRIGVAWQPASLPNTAIRGAFGIFFSPLQYSIYNHTADLSPFSPTYTFNGTATEPIPFSNPYSFSASGTGGANPFPPFASSSENPPADSPFPASAVSVGSVFSRDFRVGTTQSWNLSVEQQIGRDFAMHLAYVGSQSYHQVVPLDLNPGIYNPAPYIRNGALIVPVTGDRTTYPDYAFILQNTSAGTANYHSLQAGIEKRLSHNLQFQSNFTWARTNDTFSTGSVSFGNPLPDPFNIRFNLGRSDLNIPLISVTNFVYTTPALTGHNQLLRQTLGGWEVSGIYTMQSGLPFSIAGGGNASGSNEYGDRDDYAPGYMKLSDFGVHRGPKAQWLGQYFNPAGFSLTGNAPGTFGNTPRNLFQGPGINTGDGGVYKNWLYKERYNVQFRWEMFNAFNHASFANPNNNPLSSGFGQITAIGPIAPRVQQAALKLTF